MSTSDKGSRAGKDGVAEQLGEDAAEWREMRLGIADSSVSQGQAVTFREHGEFTGVSTQRLMLLCAPSER